MPFPLVLHNAVRVKVKVKDKFKVKVKVNVLVSVSVSVSVWVSVSVRAMVRVGDVHMLLPLVLHNAGRLEPDHRHAHEQLHRG